MLIGALIGFVLLGLTPISQHYLSILRSEEMMELTSFKFLPMCTGINRSYLIQTFFAELYALLNKNEN